MTAGHDKCDRSVNVGASRNPDRGRHAAAIQRGKTINVHSSPASSRGAVSTDGPRRSSTSPGVGHDPPWATL
jgi:hypothetical protein